MRSSRFKGLAVALFCLGFAGGAAAACTKASYDDVKDWGLDQIEKDYCAAKRATDGSSQPSTAGGGAAAGGAAAGAQRASDPVCAEQMATDMKVLTEMYKRHAPSCAAPASK